MLKRVVWLCSVLLAAVSITTIQVKKGNSTKNDFIMIKFSDDKFLELYSCVCHWRHCAVGLRASRQQTVTVTQVVGRSAYCGAYLGYSICHHNNHTAQLFCNMKSSNMSATISRICLSHSGGLCACVGLERVYTGELILTPSVYEKTCGGACSSRDPTATVSTEHVNEETSGLTSCNLTSPSPEPDSKINHTTLIFVVTSSVLGTAAITILGVFFYRRRRRCASKVATSEIYSRKVKPALTDNDSLIISVGESPSTDEMKYYPKPPIKKFHDSSTAITNSYEPVEDFLTKQYTWVKRQYEVIETDIQTTGPTCSYTEIDLPSRPLKQTDKVLSSTGELETGYIYIDDTKDLLDPLHRSHRTDLNPHRTARVGETDDPYYESVSIKSTVRPAVAAVVNVERMYAHVPCRGPPEEQLGVLGEVEEPSYTSSQYSKLREITLDNMNPYDHLNHD